jgi:hypothetical protein
MTEKRDQYSEEEAQRRFIVAVKAGLNTKPTHSKVSCQKAFRRNQEAASS